MGVMYKFLDDMELLINEMLDTYEIKDSSQTFYRGRIKKFFLEYMDSPNNNSRPLNAITYYDINSYLENLKCSDAEKVNYYNSLKRFFEFTYLKGKTTEIISHVLKPISKKKLKEVLNEEEYKKLSGFIFNRDNNLNERLILGLFLFTGLSRQYVGNLRNNQFVFEQGSYNLIIWKDDEEIKLPLKAELQLIINEYLINLPQECKLDKVITMDENSISTYVSNLVNTIIRKKCTPTILSNTFISKALSNGTYIWEVSKLTLESVSTIEKHMINSDNLVNKQTSILNSF
jgi:integrase